MTVKEIWELDQTSMVDLIVNLQAEKRELEAQNKELEVKLSMSKEIAEDNKRCYHKAESNNKELTQKDFERKKDNHKFALKYRRTIEALESNNKELRGRVKWFGHKPNCAGARFNNMDACNCGLSKLLEK